MKSKALQMLVPGGNPNGMKIIELAGWSGKCFILPRQNLKELKDRLEVNHPGLYLLFGVDEASGDELAYIGESENFYNRISNHDSNKDFWNLAVIFTGGLNRAFVKYLEYRATTLAHEANRMTMENKVQPQENALSEFEKVTVDQYFENVQFILEAIGYQVFDKIEESISDEKIYQFSDVKNKEGSGKGSILENGGFIVYKGSLSRINETPSFKGSGPRLRKKLIEEGVLKKYDDKSYIFTKDYIFRTPSAASDVISGRSTNGWTGWKDKSGKTLDENLRK